MNNKKRSKKQKSNSYFKKILVLLFFGYFLVYVPVLLQTIKQMIVEHQLPTYFTVIIIMLTFISVMFAFFDLYFFTYNLIGFMDYKKDYELTKPKMKFAFLVFAHNEEQVIESSLESLFAVDYPKELYDVFVVADNCTDQTIPICNRLKDTYNLHVIVRENDRLRGKQYAASDVVNKVIPNNKNFEDKDGIIFLDADNHINAQFLNEINSDMIAHPYIDVVQAKLGVKNPNTNVISRGYAATYNVFNRFYQFGKRNLNVNSHIGGTGFVVRRDVLLAHGWSTTSLTEDYETAVKYTILGKKIRWNHFAVIYDEKPTNMKISLVQRLRWVRGHWQVVFANFFNICKSRKTMGVLNWIDQIATALSLGKAMNYFVGVILGLVIGLSTQQWMYLYVPLVILSMSYLLFLIQTYYVLTREENEPPVLALYHTLTYTIAAFVYNITFMILHFHGFITWRNKTWKRTEHKMTVVERRDTNETTG